MSSKTATLMVADDDAVIRQVIAYGLKAAGMRADFYETGDELLEDMDDRVEVCILDIQMPGSDGLECLQKIKSDFPQTEVIILTNINQANEALEAVRLGAYDYLTKPFDMKDLKNRVSHAMSFSRNKRERDALKLSLSEPKLDMPKLGDSSAMSEVQELVSKIAPTNNSVLLTGESGTGKTLLARVIHASSPRSNNPFISVSCPSLPGELLESELFGHEKGAFTGANESRLGRVDLAEGGTLFLDEIGEMSLALQTKLLTFLQDRSYFRIGGEKLIESNVRVIAATNQDLEERVQDGVFREDLFYRLNVLPIEMPNLAERLEDIPMLVDNFVARYALTNEQEIPEVQPEFYRQLQILPWPGNVRELENFVVRAMTLRNAPEVLTVEDIVTRKQPGVDAQIGLGGRSLADIEKQAIIETLKLCGSRKAEAARMLGIAEKSIYNKMRRHGLIED